METRKRAKEDENDPTVRLKEDMEGEKLCYYEFGLHINVA